jgi:hypothetical protein
VSIRHDAARFDFLVAKVSEILSSRSEMKRRAASAKAQTRHVSFGCSIVERNGANDWIVGKGQVQHHPTNDWVIEPLPRSFDLTTITMWAKGHSKWEVVLIGRQHVAHTPQMCLLHNEYQ